jgi:hypothetical protein
VLDVPGSSKQRQRPRSSEPSQTDHSLGRRRDPQLGSVAKGELLVAWHIVVVPTPKLCRRRDLLQPLIERRVGVREPTGPKAVDQHATTVGLRDGCVVDAAYLDEA